MLSFLPRELFVKPPQITLILAIGPWGRGVMHLISPLGGKGLMTRKTIVEHGAVTQE